MPIVASVACKINEKNYLKNLIFKTSLIQTKYKLKHTLNKNFLAYNFD